MLIRGFLFLSLILFCCSCAAPAVLISSCTSDQNQKYENDFYHGIKLDSGSENIAEKIKLFERALNNSNEYIRQAAAGELAVLMTQGAELSDKTTERMRMEAPSLWAEAFDIFQPNPAGNGNVPDREKALSFLLNFGQNAAFFDGVRFFVISECEKQGLFFSNTELAAIEGHFAASRSRYNDALDFFRAFQTSGDSGNSWPAQMPKIFFEHPNLINMLGRTFQYTQSGAEGQTLFLQWEKNLQDQTDDLKYRLIFYAARITLRMGQSAQSVPLFERALALAPDYEQLDACIWYILDSIMTGPVNIIMERLEQLVPQWYSGSNYNTLLERYLHRLVSARDWRRVIRTYDLIKDTNANIKAGFAWIIARALEEGYLSAEDKRLASAAVNSDTAVPLIFFQIAYNTGESLTMPALYYRMQSADVLGMPLLTYEEGGALCEDEEAPSFALQFLLGFFSNDAAGLSVPYIRQMQRTLSPCELRAVAQALHDTEMYALSMEMVSLYIYREGYNRERRDLELLYPIPFKDLIETHAQLFDIAPPLFFGLVRSESAFRSDVVSHAGAVGLSQLMPGTARDQAERIRRAGGPDFFGSNGDVDSTDPYLNIYIGAFYFNYLLSRFDNIEQFALMSYNGGETRVRRWRAAAGGLPVDLIVETAAIYETRDYGKRVPAIGKIYKELYYR